MKTSAVLGLLILFFNPLGLTSAEREDLGSVANLFALKSAVDDPDNVLRSWSGDLISPCSWIFVECTGDGKVMRVDLGGNALRGPLPASLGNLKTVKYLALYDNNLNGAIPSELGNISSLVSLDLRGNHFTGSIPASLGKLTNLRFLWLDSNRLSGAIPESLTRLSNLKVLHLSNNQLTGKIPYYGALAKFPAASFDGNSDLCGPPLSEPCSK